MSNQEHVVNETFQKSIATLMEKGKKRRAGHEQSPCH